MIALPRLTLLACFSCCGLACEDPVGNEPPAAGEDDATGSSSADGTPSGTAGTEESGSTGGSDQTPADAPTYHQDVAPIVHRSCVGCHTGGGIAPFPIETYTQAAMLGPLIAVHVEQRTMPPWHAIETQECEPPAPFLDDPRLSDEEIQLVMEWVDAGTPEGDPDAPAELPEAPDLDLADPSGMFEMPAAIEIDGSEDRFVCFSIDLGLDREVWITGSQLIPGNPKIVHHTTIYTDESGASADLVGEDGYYECFGGSGVSGARMLGAYLPGSLPTALPAGTGVHVPQGARIVLGFHYHPTGLGPEVDQSLLAVRWTEDRPAREAQFDLVGNFSSAPGLQPGPGDGAGPEFRIPAGVDDHVEVMEWTAPQGFDEAKLFAVVSHMHYVGVDLKLDIVRAASGQTDCMLQTPAWDFDWQRLYFYDVAIDDAPSIFPGDTVRIRCTYDNSLANPALADILAEQGLSEPTDVLLGESSLEEMCVGGLGIAI